MASKNILKNNTAYMLVNRRTGLVLQAPAVCGGSTSQEKASGSKEQLWNAVSCGENNFRFENPATGWKLDTIYGGTINGTWTNVWDEESETQLWHVEIASRGFRKLTNVKADKVLDVAFLSMEPGIPLQLWDDVGGDNQEWKLVEFPSAESAALIAGTTLKTAAKKAAAKSGKLIEGAEDVLSDMAGMAAEAMNTVKPAVKKAKRATKKAVKEVSEKTAKTTRKMKEAAKPMTESARETLKGAMDAAEDFIDSLKKED